MAFTLTWANLTTAARGLAKNVPFPSTAVEAQVCDMVSSTMYSARTDWQWPLTTIAGGAIPLVDGIQDYDVPANLARLQRLYLRRTDTDPDQFRELDIAQELTEDLTKRSWLTIRAGSHEAGVGKIRLEAAVEIPTDVEIEIGGTYQPNVTKITATSQDLWFPDEYAEVAIEGLLYWLYKHSNDDRAGTAAFAEGRFQYTGQLATFMAGVERMARAQDQRGIQTIFPSESMGADRSQGGSFNIFGWN